MKQQSNPDGGRRIFSGQYAYLKKNTGENTCKTILRYSKILEELVNVAQAQSQNMQIGKL